MTRVIRYLFLLIICTENLQSQEKPDLKNEEIFLYIGTYTEGKPDKGIYIYKFDPSNGSVKQIIAGSNIINPSFITVTANGKFIYACTETKLKNAGSVSAFMFDKKENRFKFLNKQSSKGENPVYVSLSRDEKVLVNANYTGGSISVYPIDVNHELDEATQVIRYSDSSIIKDRQSSPHVHAAVFSPSYDYIYFTDLGADKIRVYKFDSSSFTPLQKTETDFVKTFPGSGPRHLTFHPNGKFAYCIEEISETVSAYKYHDGILEPIQRVATRDSTPHTSYGSADIHVSPDGKFLYASNRGDKNTITIFSVSEDGTLETVAYQSTLGEHPRNFCIDPTGDFLFVANLGSNEVVIFKRDEFTGLLKETGVRISVPRPSSLVMRGIKK